MSRLLAARPTILDRYVVREVVPPTLIGLLLFTFIVLLDQIPQLLKILVSRGADLATVTRALVYLLPSIFSITIPMSFLLGVLLAFGRMASESEIVALRASGISPARLLRPVVALSTAAMMLTFYIMAVALPAANQAYREIVFALVISKAKTGVKPRVFTDADLVPGMILYVSDIPSATGQWRNVFIHDQRGRPRVILARTGRLIVEKERQYVALQLEDGVIHTFNATVPAQYVETRFHGTATLPLPFDEFFPKVPLTKGDREMSIPELRHRVQELRKQNRRDWVLYAVELHKKFAIPVACLVFGLLGLGLSLGSKKEARSAAFALSIAVIFVYYVIIRLGEQAGDKHMLPPAVAMWAANVILGAAAVVLLVLNHREAAFDPLDVSHYKALLPTIRRAVPTAEQPVPVPRPGRHRPPPRRVVVIRVPRWHLPLPGILDRYVVRSFLGHFALVLLSFWAIYVLVDFTTNIFDDIEDNRVKGAVVLNYYVFQSPYLVQLLMPAAVLVSVLTTFGILARSNEITAMKAGGISVYRATFPVIAIGALMTVGSFLAAELVLPTTNRVANEHFNVIKGRPPQSTNLMERRWLLGTRDQLYNFDYLEKGPRDGVTLYGFSIYDMDEAAWKLKARTYASRAAWNGRGYDLERGHRHTFGERTTLRQFQHAHANDLDPPSYFGQEQRESDTLSFGELRRHIAGLESRGLDVVGLRVQLHRKVSFPAVSLVMVLIGVPFSFVVARRGALYGIAAAILLSIVYWAFLAVFEEFGRGGLLPPMLAAWTPNLLFGLAGLYLLFTLET